MTTEKDEDNTLSDLVEELEKVDEDTDDATDNETSISGRDGERIELDADTDDEKVIKK